MNKDSRHKKGTPWTDRQYQLALRECNPALDLVGSFVKIDTKSRFSCKECGYEWDTLPATLLRGHGCPSCAGVARLSPDEFRELVARKNPDITVVGDYVDSKTHVACLCKACGYEWEAHPTTLKRGGGCPRCGGSLRLTQEEFLRRVAIKNPDVIPSGTYENNRTRFDCLCRTCGYKWNAEASSLMAGTGCPNCAGRPLINTQDFKRRLAGNNPAIEVLGEYVNNRTPIACRCGKCGYEWSPIPTVVLQQGNCPRCVGRPNKDTAYFKKELAAKNNKIEVLGNYVNDKTPIQLRCKVCQNEWAVAPSGLLQGRGCPKCGRESMKAKRRKDPNDFIGQLKRVHPDIEFVGEYVNTHTKASFKCLTCGNVWEAEPNSVLNAGTGCPRCAWSQTSFMEQFILCSFESALGSGSVLSRDTNAMGFELDVFIPSLKLAFEPGSWNWHKNTLDRDQMKRQKCKDAGIRLITIYDNVSAGENPSVEADLYSFTFDLASEDELVSLRKIITNNLHDCGIEPELDWTEIAKEASKRAKRPAAEDFIRRLSIRQPTIEALEEYRTVHHKIRFRCKTCGSEWMAEPNAVLNRGTGCPTCAGRPHIDTESFKQTIAEKFPEIEVLGEYKNRITPIKCRCKDCGYVWEPRPSTLLKGKGCLACTRKRVAKYARSCQNKTVDRVIAICAVHTRIE